VSAGDGSSFVSPNGHLCGLFAVDIAGFNASCRDDDIQIYVHESLYAMLQKAFDRSDVPWLSAWAYVLGALPESEAGAG